VSDASSPSPLPFHIPFPSLPFHSCMSVSGAARVRDASSGAGKTLAVSRLLMIWWAFHEGMHPYSRVPDAYLTSSACPNNCPKT
jgi:hypothetical protein